MKSFIFILPLLFALLAGCSTDLEQNSRADIWKGLPNQLLTPDEVQTEISLKMHRVKDFLKTEGLDGMLLTQVRDFYWMTAGLANNQIVLNKDVGAASLLIMKDGSRFLICSGSEAPRLMNETPGKLGYTLRMYNWYEANPVKDTRGEIIKSIARGGKIGVRYL